MDRGAWWAAVHRDTKSQTGPKRLSTHNAPMSDPLELCENVVLSNCVIIIRKQLFQNFEVFSCLLWKSEKGKVSKKKSSDLTL